MRRIKRATFSAVTVFLFSILAGHAAYAITAGQVDDFEDGTVQGWTEGSSSPNPPTNINTGGPAGTDDNFLRNIASGFGPGGKLVHINQVQWSGDYLAEGIVEIRAQVKLIAGGEILLRAGFRGAGETNDQTGWVSTSFERVTSNGQWNEVVFSIAEADLTNSGSSQTYQQTMSNVEEFRIFNSTGPSWTGGPFVNMTMGLDNIEAVGPAGQAYQGWLWETAVINNPLPQLDEELCFGQINLTIFDDDNWGLTGEDACWGRRTTNSNPAINYVNYDGMTIQGTETFEAQSTQPLVSAGGNLLEVYGEDIEMGVGQGEERLATILADPNDGDLLIIGGYGSFDDGSSQEAGGYIDVLAKANPAAAASRQTADLTGRWRFANFIRTVLPGSNPTIKFASGTALSILLNTAPSCTYETSDVFQEPQFDLNGDSYLITQFDQGVGVNLTDRGTNALVTDTTLAACSWGIDGDGYLEVSGTDDGDPFTVRKVISDDNNYLVNAPDTGGVLDSPQSLSLAFRAPSAITESDIDGTFLYYLNLTDFEATGQGHSQFQTGPQENDIFGRGIISFDANTQTTAPAGQTGFWYECDSTFANSEASYEINGDQTQGAVTTSMELTSEYLDFDGCAFSLDTDGSLLVNFTFAESSGPDEEILFAGYVNNTGDVFAIYDMDSEPDPYDEFMIEDESSVRQILGMRYTGDPNGDEDGDGLTNLEEFQFPLPPPPPLSEVFGIDDLNGNGFAEAVIVVDIGGSVFVQIRDGDDGAPISDIDFGTDPAIAAAVIDDIEGTGAPEIVVLGLRPSGQVRAQVRDSITGALVNTIFYGNVYAPLDMTVVPDTDGNNAAEIAVMGRSAAGGVRVQARDALSDAVTSTTFYGDNADPVDLNAIVDLNTNTEPEVIVHARVTASGQNRAQIRDTSTSLMVRQLFFGSVYTPLQLAIIGDVSGDGLPDVAQLGVRSDTGAIRVQIRATSGGPVISNAFLGAADIPIETVGIGDANSNGSPDTATLVQRPDDTGKVVLRDGADGAFIGNIFFGAIDDPVGLALIEDLDGSGDPELAALGERNGVRRVQIRDSISGANINTIDYP